MKPADLLNEFSVKIYEPPLSSMRDDGTICEPSNRVAVLMLVVDFETEVSMNGINNFIGNSSGRFGNETVAALNTIGAQTQAALLERILTVAENAGMTHDAIQRERSGLGEFAVTTFKELHGDKWDVASAEIRDIESEIDYSDLMSCAQNYVQQHTEEFHKALDIARD